MGFLSKLLGSPWICAGLGLMIIGPALTTAGGISVDSPSHSGHLESEALSIHSSFEEAFNNKEDYATIKALAASRSSKLKSLMLTNPSVALEIAENFKSFQSEKQDLDHKNIFNQLALDGHLENHFHSNSDIVYACGLSFKGKAAGMFQQNMNQNNDNNNQHKNNKDNTNTYFCEESIFILNFRKSFKVHIDPNYHTLLKPHSTFRDITTKGFYLDDTVVIHNPNENQLMGAGDPDYPASSIPSFQVQSLGANSLLYINLQFTDLMGDPATPQQNQVIYSNTNSFFTEASYGLASVAPVTYTPTLTLPLTSVNYGADYNTLSTDANNVANAWLATQPGNLTVNSFNLWVWEFAHRTQFTWAGLGSVGGKGVWNNGNVDASFGTKVICHELGHNFGMNHASAWHVSDSNPLSPTGANDEYGDTFDMMGYGFGNGAHYNAFYKLNLKWLDLNTNVASCGTSCPTLTQQIWPSDQMASLSYINAIDVLRSNNQPTGNHYWISTKSGGSVAGTGYWTPDKLGVYIHVSQATYGIPKAYLLNLHPEYNNNQGVDHAALQVGETYSECAQNIHITNFAFVPCTGQTFNCATVVVNRVSGSSQILQINVNMPSTIAVGMPVTFTATTNAPAALITWNFQQSTYNNLVGPSQSYTFSTAGWNTVMVQATDMAGTATRWFFSVGVGAATGTAPPLASQSWYMTCNTGRVYGYTGTFNGGASSGPTPPPTPKWFETGFGPCSVSCGGGVSTQMVQCKQGSNIVADSLCTGLKPVSSIQCNTLSCDQYSWVTGAWGSCSATCGGGIQTRSASCQLVVSVQGVIGSVDTTGAKCAGTPAVTSQPCESQPCVTTGANNNAQNCNQAGICTCLHGFTGPQCTIAPSVTVTGPSGSVSAGKIVMITWTFTGVASTVSIQLARAGSQYGYYIVHNANNTGSYSYTIPLNASAGAYVFYVGLNVASNIVPAISGVPASQVVSSSPVFEILDSCRVTGFTCFNGGVCQNGACVCLPGFSGPQCLTSVCQNTTCNGGICTATALGPVCSNCPAGYTGTFCQNPPNCNVNCLNGGVPATGCSLCNCNVNYQSPLATSWAGPTCGTCGLSCLNGGTPSSDCTRCNCVSPYFGPSCSSFFQIVTVNFGTPMDLSQLSSSDQLNFANLALADFAFAMGLPDTSSLALDHYRAISPKTPTFTSNSNSPVPASPYGFAIAVRFLPPLGARDTISFQSLASSSSSSLIFSGVAGSYVTSINIGDTAPANNGGDGGGGSTLSTNAIGAIVIVIIVLLLVAALVYYCWRRRQRAKATLHSTRAVGFSTV